METVEFRSRSRFAFPTGWGTPAIDIAMRRDPDPVDSDFPATLLAMAGHDLRQPLQLITSAHDIRARILHNDEQREELARAEDATARLASMLGQLVEALQLHQRSGDDLHVRVRLRPILEGLSVEFAGSARLKDVRFRLASVRGATVSHPVLLTAMLRNLIRNAIDYTPPGGSVVVASRRRGSELRITVRDTGVGIRTNALSTIFRAFRRADQTRPDGLGLGLFIVKHAAKVLGHRVEVCTAEGRGSCFTIIATAIRCCAAEPIEGYRSDRLNCPGGTPII